MNPFEVLPTVSRSLNFRLIVRDQNALGGGIDCSELAITVDAAMGAFEVTAPNGGESIAAGSNTTITWTNNTAGICNTVDIELSLDGGLTYIPLSAGEANDGTADVLIPAGVTNVSTARIRIICADNECVQFYDISDADFEIASDCLAPLTEVSPTDAMTLPVGDPMLANLGMTNNLGSVVANIAGTLEATDDTGKLVNLDCNGDCQDIFNTTVYDTYTISADITGQYTISHGGPFGTVINLYNSPFEGSNCTNHIASSAEEEVCGDPLDLDPSITVTLTAGVAYVVKVSTFGTGFPAIPLNYDITFTNTPAGSSIYDGVILPTDYSYTYIAVNTASNNVVAESSTSNFSALTAGVYKIYGVAYYTGATTPPNPSVPANWIGSPFTSLQVSSNCQQVSSTCKTLTITGMVTCPTATTVGDGSATICSGDLAMEVSDWQATVAAANTMGLVYSSVTPIAGTTAPNNTLPSGTTPAGCAAVDQVVMAYVYCDVDGSGTVNAGDSYDLVSTYTLTVNPVIDTPTAATNACVLTITGICPGDIVNLSGQTVATGVITNNNTNAVTYTAQPGDAAGEITIMVTSGIAGSSCVYTDMEITPACPVGCPTATTVADGSATICTGDLGMEVTNWQATVAAANAMGLVYSSVTPVAGMTPPNNTLPSGTIPAGCAAVDQVVMAYVYCDVDGSGTDNAGDLYTLVSTYTLTVNPEVAAPTITSNGCSITITGDCLDDIVNLSGQTVATGVITNNNTNSVTYTAQPADVAGTIAVMVTSGITGSTCMVYMATEATPACPVNCPMTTTVTDGAATICSGALGTEVSDWQATVAAANTMGLVYSSVTPVAGTTLPNNMLPSGTIAAGCAAVDQVVMAYVYCDVDASGGDSAGDLYTLVSTYTLTVNPAIAAPALVTNACVLTVTGDCPDDIVTLSNASEGGVITTNNTNSATYTAQPADAVGTIMITITSGVTGSTCSYTATEATPACPVVCPTATTIGGGSATICTGDLATEVSDWQATVAAANTMGLVYSSVTPVAGTTPPNNTLPSGTIPAGCAAEDQVVMAYVYCDVDASGGDSAGDTYELVSTYILTVTPEIQAPTVVTNGCVVTITGICPGDLINLSNQTGMGAIAGNNTNSATYTGVPGEPAGTIDVMVSSGVAGSTCAYMSTEATPVCPTATIATIDDPCSCDDPENYLLNGDYYFHEVVEITGTTGQAWDLTAFTAGQGYDAAGNPLTLPAMMTETPAGSGIYIIEFWHIDGVGFDSDYVEAGGGMLDIMNSCMVPDFEVVCPAATDLGTFNCGTIATLAACPTTEAEAEAAPYGLTIDDMPCGAIVVLCSDDVTAVDNCVAGGQTITRTVTVLDDLNGNGMLDTGEESTDCVFTYTIEEDVTPPTITCPADVTLGCNDDVTPANTGTATATDDCSAVGDIAIAFTESSSTPIGECANQIITRVWTATDICGNTETCMQVITISDTQAPVITCPTTQILSCFETVPAPATSAADFM